MSLSLICTDLKTADESIPNPPSRLTSLPGELLSRVLDFTTASDVPVYIEHFVDMARSPDVYEAETLRMDSIPWVESYEEQRRRFPTIATTLSRGWWLDLFPKSQAEHYIDWVGINATLLV